MKRFLFLPVLVLLMNLSVQHATAQQYTIWHSPLGFVSGNPDLTIDVDFTALNTAPRVRASQSGDFFSVNLGLTLPSNVIIDEVTVCYESSNAGTFISQTRLTQMSSPESASVIHDDPTDLTDLGPTCYTSVVPSRTVGQATTLSLRLVYANASHTIRIGAIGVTVTPSSTGTASERPEVMPRPGLDAGMSYPNPFSERTTIEYRVDQPTQVQVRIYDVQGRLVRNLTDAYQTSGTHQVEWDGYDDSGSPLPSGVYFYQLQAGDAVSAKNVIQIR